MQVNSTGISLSSLPDTCLSVDVLFDSRRVWSIAIEPSDGRDRDTFKTWPASLGERLKGSSEVTVVDSANGTKLFQAEVQFTDDAERTEISDANGAPLVVNKWGDLAPDLAGLPVDVLTRLLESSQELIGVLLGLGKRPFVVGGTLLGAVREGRLLPHDDDVDIAYLSEHTNPADVAVEGLRLGHELQALGYEFMRHSAAHIQLIFRDDAGAPCYHIDIFSAFFTDDGYMNQPFHVRGKLRRDQLLPFGSVSVDGYEFPAPADPQAWLVVNYDENWQTPIPGYRLETPSTTVRRFDSWFGGFNFRREFWDRWFQETPVGSNIWSTGAEWIAKQSFTGTSILELGCGDGSLTRELGAAFPHTRIVATDYSPYALEKARRARRLDNVGFFHANLNRVESLGVVSDAALTGPFDLAANNVLEQVTPAARATALRLIRMALRSGGSAYATSYARHAANVSIDDPTTWHLDQSVLQSETTALGLVADFTPVTGNESDTHRKPYGVKFSLAATPIPHHSQPAERVSMKARIKSLIRKRAQGELQTQLVDLHAQVQELQGELDEFRRQSLRSAEILDLVEQRLSTQVPTKPTE